MCAVYAYCSNISLNKKQHNQDATISNIRWFPSREGLIYKKSIILQNRYKSKIITTITSVFVRPY